MTESIGGMCHKTTNSGESNLDLQGPDWTHHKLGTTFNSMPNISQKMEIKKHWERLGTELDVWDLDIDDKIQSMEE